MECELCNNEVECHDDILISPDSSLVCISCTSQMAINSLNKEYLVD